MTLRGSPGSGTRSPGRLWRRIAATSQLSPTSQEVDTSSQIRRRTAGCSANRRRMLDALRQGLGPAPCRRGEEVVHCVDVAVERRPARPVALHEEDEQRSVRPQPTVQAPRIVGPQPRRQRTETGLVIDGIEWRVWIPPRIGPPFQPAPEASAARSVLAAPRSRLAPRPPP